MPLPASWTQVPAAWTPIMGQDGTPCSGVIRFEQDVVVTASGGTYVPAPILAVVTNGVMASVSLPSTDDADTSPTGRTIRVIPLLSPAGPAPFSITVPAATVGTLNLATVVPVESPTPLTAVALADSALAQVFDDTDGEFRTALNARYQPLGAPEFTAVRAALRGGRSACVWAAGDSTWDTSNGAAIPRPLDYLAEQAADLFPDHYVAVRSWDTTNNRWGADRVIQAASGRRYVDNGTRSLRHRLTSAVLSTGNLDVRAHIACDNWSTAQQIVACSSTKEVAGVVSAEHSWQLMVDAGNLRLRGSSDGTTVNSLGSWARPLSGLTNGQDLWIRCTIEISATPQRLVKFYTSTDGAAWTQLGATFTEGFSTPLRAPAAGSFFEIGAAGWQPATLPFSGKIYEVQVRDGVDGPMLAPALPELWEKYPDLQATFGGSPEFRILNASSSGSAMTYHTDVTRLPRATPNFGQSVLMFCDSHNETDKSGETGWITPFEDWVEAVQARLPRAAVVLVKQNPHTTQNVNEGVYGAYHKQRLDELARLASQHGWGLLDLYGAFLADSRWSDAGSVLMNADGVHPSDVIGYGLGGTALQAFAGLAAAGD